MSERSFREPRQRGFNHDFGPHRTRGHAVPASESARRPQPVSGPPVRATVKWFNLEKGFGFVVLGDGSGDAFLHASVVEQSGRDGSVLKPGATLQVAVGHGQKGLQVTEILEVDESTVEPALPRPGTRLAAPRAAPDRSSRMTGTVKWYSPERGFGFIAVDSGRREVFIHATTLQRSRIATLSEGQRVTLEAVEGRKGLEAVTIACAD